MESWNKDARKETVITDIDALVPQDHLLRKMIERVMDYKWLYERLESYYCHDMCLLSLDKTVRQNPCFLQMKTGVL